jgi:hypothetical protein
MLRANLTSPPQPDIRTKAGGDEGLVGFVMLVSRPQPDRTPALVVDALDEISETMACSYA